MNTISPEAFVEFKQWMADNAQHREEMKKRRDKLQAGIVREQIEKGLLLTR